jgi:hypothetical protein
MSQNSAPKIRIQYSSYFATFFKVWKLALWELRIRALNDRFRQSVIAGEIFITRSVQALAPEEQEQLIAKIRVYKAFKKGNAPCGGHDYDRHDFGSTEQKGIEYCWTINYYNHDFSGVGENPGDAEETQRVLAVMQLKEYVQNRYNTDDLRFLRDFVRMK